MNHRFSPVLTKKVLCFIYFFLFISLACQLPLISSNTNPNTGQPDQAAKEQTEQAAISGTLAQKAADLISVTQTAENYKVQMETINAAQAVIQSAQDEATRIMVEAQQQGTLDANTAIQNQLHGTETAIAETNSQSPPKIISIQFRDYIKADSSKYLGELAFSDNNGNINRLVLTVIHAINFDGKDFDPTEFIISGDKYEGVIQLEIRCKIKQQVTLRATLYDTTGYNSNNKEFTFVCN